MKTGTQLPNGAVVLECSGRVILAKNNCGTRDEYVTWKWDGKDPASTVFGHYHELLTLAVRDYVDRVAEELEFSLADRRAEEHEADRISDKWRTR